MRKRNVWIGLLLLALCAGAIGIWIASSASDAPTPAPAQPEPQRPEPAIITPAPLVANAAPEATTVVDEPPTLEPPDEAAKEPAQPVPAEPENPNEFRLDYHIRAFVVDDLGNPIEGASVMIWAQLYRSGESKPVSRPVVMVGKSDSRGLVDSTSRIEISGEDVAWLKGTASVVGRKEGYFADEPLEVEIVNGSWKTEEPINIRMTAGGAVRGVLLDENGQPVTRGRVSMGNGAGSATPNERGEFLIEPAKPGEYELHYNPATYKPIRTVMVRSRHTVDVGTLVLERTNSVMMSVVDDDGPIKGEWEIVLTDESGRIEQRVARMDQPAGWVSSIPATTYTIEIRKSGYQSVVREHVVVGELDWVRLGEIKLKPTGQERGELAMK